MRIENGKVIIETQTDVEQYRQRKLQENVSIDQQILSAQANITRLQARKAANEAEIATLDAQ
jgi:cell division protein FtsB